MPKKNAAAQALVARRWKKPGEREKQADVARSIASRMTKEQLAARAAAIVASRNGKIVPLRDKKKAVPKRRKS
jgi:adenylate kinase